MFSLKQFTKTAQDFNTKILTVSRQYTRNCRSSDLSETKNCLWHLLAPPRPKTNIYRSCKHSTRCGNRTRATCVSCTVAKKLTIS